MVNNKNLFASSKLPSGCDQTITLMSSLQLWLPAQGQASHHSKMEKRGLKTPPMTEELLGLDSC